VGDKANSVEREREREREREIYTPAVVHVEVDLSGKLVCAHLLCAQDDMLHCALLASHSQVPRHKPVRRMCEESEMQDTHSTL